MRGALSGLTTRGRCLLAAGVAAALCSAVLNERDLLRVAVFVVVLPLVSAALAASARVGLSARRFLLPPRVPAGDDSNVVLEVHAHGRVPAGGLLLEDGVPYTLGGKPRFVVERLRRRGIARLGYRVHPIMRGVHQLGPLRARITDPFGLAEFERELAGQSRMVVVPRTVPLFGLPGGSGTGIGDDGSVRLRSGQGEDDAVVRQYRQGDDLRRVHWRSTARRDELMVRVEERPWRGGTTVLLDRRMAAHRGRGPTASLEWAVSLCGSICLHLHRCGQQVRLVAEDGQVLVGDNAETGYSDDVVLDALAMLQLTHAGDATYGVDPGAGHELIAILGAMTTTEAAELARARSRRARSLAVLLDVNTWAGSGEGSAGDQNDSAELLRESGWGVVIAGKQAGFPEVWMELCRVGAARSRTASGGTR
ncbi:MAG TPA: DUF58 domain-containing protein [Pseudonocardiaceae bacterium]|jgi:uncharacterized protein (DUF58 family)|nr:DUF58 domain-containing protein [Pseudonocardiaceae bacterium]